MVGTNPSTIPSSPPSSPRPRFCYLRRLHGYYGYGFFLNVRNGIGKHFIQQVEDNSPADLTGIREGDRIVEVNGVNVYDVDYNKVVELILKHVEHVFLILLDAAANDEFTDQIITSATPDLIYKETPVFKISIDKIIWEKDDYIKMIPEMEEIEDKTQEENVKNAFKEQQQKEKFALLKKIGIGAGIGLGVGAAMGLAAVIAIPLVVGSIGFGAGGIAAGSAAAQMMSAAAIANGGSIAAGSSVAVLQSIGAAGLAGTTQAALVAGGTATGALIGTSSALLLKPSVRGNGCIRL